MYRVEFYSDKDNHSDIEEFLDELKEKSKTSKNDRIQLKQILFYIDLLSKVGTRLGDNYTKFIEDGIWELRPGFNRIFYFYYDNDQFVLLHHFRKKTQKTPKKEIVRAKNERDDYLNRKKGDRLWRHGMNIKKK